MKTNKDFRMTKEHKTILALTDNPARRHELKQLFIEAQVAYIKAKQAKFKENVGKGEEL